MSVQRSSLPRLSRGIYYWIATYSILAVCLSLEIESVPSVQLSPVTFVTVALNNTLNFECTVIENDTTTDYTIHWTITYNYQLLEDFDYQVTFHSGSNDNNDNSSSNTSSTNTTSSTSSVSSSQLSYTATKVMNASVVSCSTQSAPDGPLLHTVSCTVWIQDHLSSVNELSCTDSGICSWIAPFNLIGVDISQYNVTVVQNSTVIQQGCTTDTSWQFCPSRIDEFGEYRLLVTPINSLSFVGETADTAGVLEIGGSTSLEIVSLTKKSLSLFYFTFNIEQHLLICVSSIEAWVTNELRNESFNASRVTLSNDDTTSLQLEFNIQENMKWSLDVLVYLKKSLVSSVKTAASTFDVQDFSAANPAFGVACFQCTFILNSDAKGCSVMLEDDRAESTDPVVLVIQKKSNNVAMYDHCISNVKNGTYRVLVHDQDDTNLLSNEPAFIIESFSVNGIVITGPLQASPSTTTIEISEDESPDKFLHWHFIFLIVTSALIMVLILVVFLCIIAHKKRLLLKLVINDPVRLMSHIQIERSNDIDQSPTAPVAISESINGPPTVSRIQLERSNDIEQSQTAPVAIPESINRPSTDELMSHESNDIDQSLTVSLESIDQLPTVELMSHERSNDIDQSPTAPVAIPESVNRPPTTGNNERSNDADQSVTAPVAAPESVNRPPTTGNNERSNDADQSVTAPVTIPESINRPPTTVSRIQLERSNDIEQSQTVPVAISESVNGLPTDQLMSHESNDIDQSLTAPVAIPESINRPTTVGRIQLVRINNINQSLATRRYIVIQETLV